MIISSKTQIEEHRGLIRLKMRMKCGSLEVLFTVVKYGRKGRSLNEEPLVHQSDGESQRKTRRICERKIKESE